VASIVTEVMANSLAAAGPAARPAEAAARGGYLDEIVQPEDTRDRLESALAALAGDLSWPRPALGDEHDP